MNQSNGIRKSKAFRCLSTFVTSLFLFSTALSSLPSVSSTKADTILEANSSTEVTSSGLNTENVDVSWTRTHDYRNAAKKMSNDGKREIFPAKPAGYVNSVHNSYANYSEYWQTGTNGEKVMKAYYDITIGTHGAEDAKKGTAGIFVTDNLFKSSKQNIIFNYETLTQLMKAEDALVWDGKKETPDSYSPYRNAVVQEYLNTAVGSNYYLQDLQDKTQPSLAIKRVEGISQETYPEFATWQYMLYDNKTAGPDQMRLFTGEFEVGTDEAYKYDYYLTVGDNKDKILAIDDTIMVLVDGIPTGINYTTSANYQNSTIKLQTGSKTYDMNFKQAENCRPQNNLPISKECSLTTDEGNKHAGLSIFADTLHAHLDSIVDGEAIGCITDEIKAKVSEEPSNTTHKLEVIASDYNLSGGMTKLNVIKVAKPQAEIVKEALVDGKVVSSSVDNSIGNAKSSDEINYRFTYKNSGKVTLSNILFEDNLLNATIGVVNGEVKASIAGTDYEASDIKVQKYDASNKLVSSGDASLLKGDLEAGQYIVVTSDKFTHVPTKSEIQAGKVENTVKTTANYVDFYGQGTLKNEEEAKVVVTINENPAIDVIKEAYNAPVTDASKKLLATSEDVEPSNYIENGKTAYYKFIVKNTGDCVLNNINVNDLDLNISLTASDYKGKTLDTLNIKKFNKDGTEVNETVAKVREKLKTLEPGQYLEISDQTFIIKEGITDSFKNTVKASGTTDGDKTVEDQVAVSVKPEGIKEVIVILDAPGSKESEFEVTVEGSDGTEKTVKLKDTEKFIVNDVIDMKNGVDYEVYQKIDENYKLVNINTGDGFKTAKDVSNNISFNLDEVSESPAEIIIHDIPRVFVNMVCEKDQDKVFTVNVEGTDKTLELKHGDRVEITDEISKDKTFAVTEVVPDGYELIKVDIKNGTDIDGKKEVSNSIKFNYDTIVSTEDITLYNSLPEDEVEPAEDFKQSIDVQKEAYVDNNLVASSEVEVPLKTVYLGKTIDYKLSIKNNGAKALKNVILDDETLKIVVSGEGITKNGTKVNSQSLVVMKYDSNGNVIVSGTEKDLSTIMAELGVDEKIVVSDTLLLAETPKNSGTITNTVVGKGKYERDKVLTDISDNATVDVKVIEDSKVSIDKFVSKVERDGKIIYDSKAVPALKVPERLYPEDKVEFGFTITNNSESKVTNLLLRDTLKNLTKPSLQSISNWTFTKDGEAFNHNSFSLNIGESISLVCNQWVIGNDYIRNNENVVDLLQKQPDNSEKLLGSDKELLVVYPKVFVNMDCKQDTEKKFYVTVKGDNGFETGMYLKNGDRVDISDLLDFDVNYVVNETIPMNFTLTQVDIEKGKDTHGNKIVPNDLEFTLMTVVSPEEITLHNVKRESEEFQSDSDVTNTLILKKN